MDTCAAYLSAILSQLVFKFNLLNLKLTPIFSLVGELLFLPLNDRFIICHQFHYFGVVSSRKEKVGY